MVLGIFLGYLLPAAADQSRRFSLALSRRRLKRKLHSHFHFLLLHFIRTFFYSWQLTNRSIQLKKITAVKRICSSISIKQKNLEQQSLDSRTALRKTLLLLLLKGLWGFSVFLTLCGFFFPFGWVYHCCFALLVVCLLACLFLWFLVLFLLLQNQKGP